MPTVAGGGCTLHKFKVGGAVKKKVKKKNEMRVGPVVFGWVFTNEYGRPAALFMISVRVFNKQLKAKSRAIKKIAIGKKKHIEEEEEASAA